MSKLLILNRNHDSDDPIILDDPKLALKIIHSLIKAGQNKDKIELYRLTLLHYRKVSHD